MVLLCMSRMLPACMGSGTAFAMSTSFSGIQTPPTPGQCTAMFVVPVRVGHDVHAAILDGGIVQGQPHRQHLGLVRLFHHHAVVLVPGHGYGEVRRILHADDVTRHLHADVLYGVGKDFRPKNTLGASQARREFTSRLKTASPVCMGSVGSLGFLRQ